jgi:hypothetical protein
MWRSLNPEFGGDDGVASESSGAVAAAFLLLLVALVSAGVGGL